jgi:hypothetical protein
MGETEEVAGQAVKWVAEGAVIREPSPPSSCGIGTGVKGGVEEKGSEVVSWFRDRCAKL